MADQEDYSWHFDKRVPLALVVMIAIQTAGAIWWASTVTSTMESLNTRVSFNEETNRRQYDRMNSDKAKANEVAERLARIEGSIKSIEQQGSILVDYVLKKGEQK